MTRRRCARRSPWPAWTRSSRGSLDFRDPWGNHIQVVDYREIQFTKTPAVLRGMGLERLQKSEGALEELSRKGLA